MATKPLTPEQIGDAMRLMQAFELWQASRQCERLAHTQEAFLAELENAFGEKTMNQSALSQYLNGQIPLNAEALRRFCRVLGVSAARISPAIVRTSVNQARELLATPDDVTDVEPAIEPSRKRLAAKR
jgi:hypothetical protein